MKSKVKPRKSKHEPELILTFTEKKTLKKSSRPVLESKIRSTLQKPS